jgi:hypothetical protein
MIPTVLMLNPEAVTSTAKVRTAPTANRKILTPRLTPDLLDDASISLASCRRLARFPNRDRLPAASLGFSAPTAALISRHPKKPMQRTGTRFDLAFLKAPRWQQNWPPPSSALGSGQAELLEPPEGVFE